jgi:nucleoside-diphosphate-sugar epimerase
MSYSAAVSCDDMSESMHLVCVTGATGFIGSHVLPLLQRPGVRVRVLTRSVQTDLGDVDSFVGDLFDANSLACFMQGADILINLAQPSGSLADEQFSAGMNNLALAAREAGVRRVLHISTAMVIGIPTANRVTEETPGLPKTIYERQKFSAEQVLRAGLGAAVDFGVLRPAAVFGPGGQNLLKLARTIASGSAPKRRVLRFLHGKRRMHLVSVRDVADAIIFLAFLTRPLAGNVFLIASDEEPTNNYQAVDSILGAAMGKPSRLSSVSMPSSFLGLLLRLAGRSQAAPRLIYDASKIRSWGFQPRSDFVLALEDFAKFYMKKSRQ